MITRSRRNAHTVVILSDQTKWGKISYDEFVSIFFVISEFMWGGRYAERFDGEENSNLYDQEIRKNALKKGNH